MNRLVLVLVLVLVIGRSAYTQTRLLSDFETEADVKLWTPTGETKAEWSDEARAVTSGKRAAKLSFPASPQGYPGLHGEAKALRSDWSGFDAFKADIFNPSDKIVTLSMRFDDPQTTKWFTAAYAEFSLRPGPNAVEVPLKDMKVADGTRALDLAKIRNFSFHRSEPKEAVVLFLDNVRLEKSAAANVAVEGLRVFDFGPANSPLWAIAARVTAQTAYDAKVGFGWLDKENFQEGNDGAPDTLAGDWVGGSHYGPFAHSFRLDTPDGEYGVAFIARPPTPVRTFGVRVGEEKLFEKVITPQTAPTTDNLFAGLLREYSPNQDAFAKYIEPEFPVRVGKATAREGHLDITFDSCNTHFLAVWPIAAQADAEKWLRSLHEARRKEFATRHYFLNLPKQDNDPAAWPEEDRQRGYVVFSRPLHKPIYPNTVPAPAERVKEPTMYVPWQGSDSASFAIHAFEDLAGVQVSMSRLNWGMGLWPEESVLLREVRYIEKQGPKGVFTPTPSHLMPVRPITDMPQGFTRQFVVIVRTPIRNYTPYHADITVKADGRPTTTFRIAVHVLPIELPPLRENFTASFYYSHPWNDGMNYRYSLTDDREGAREALRRELRDLREHGCNSLQLSFPSATVRRNKEGKVEVKLDFERLNEEVRALRQAGFDFRNEFMMSTLNFAHYRLMRFGLKEFSPEFNEAFLDAITQVDAWAKERELRVLFWPVDEPREQMLNDWNRNLADTIKYLQLFRQRPGLRTTVTPMGDAIDGVDHTPMIPLMDVVQTHPWNKSKRQVEMVKNNPKQQLWFYNAGIGRFVYGFYPWARGVQGYWQWHYQWWERPYDIFGEGWGAVLPSPDGPLPTLAYELAREGINDYRYIAFLETLIKNAEEGGDANQKQIAAQAKTALDAIRKQIPEWPDSGLETGTEAGGSAPSAIDDQLAAWRQQIIGFIMQLRKKD